MSVRITGWGAATPAQVLTNAELDERLDLDPGWIEHRTGIAERRVAAPDETTATLATDAARAALEHAALDADQIDLLVVATTTPEQPIPSTAAIVAGNLGVRGGALDINAACTGFIAAFLTAAPVLALGQGQHALVIGAETFSRIVDPHDRSTAVLFGDAAAAIVLTNTPGDEPGLVAWDLGCDPTRRALVELTAGGSRQPTTPDTLRNRANYLRMSGRAVFDFAVPTLIASATRTLQRAGKSVDDLSAFIPHQANARILDLVADGLGLAPAQIVTNLERFGNTSAASIPLALTEAADHGRFRADDLMLLTAVGAGMTSGSLLIRW